MALRWRWGDRAGENPDCTGTQEPNGSWRRQEPPWQGPSVPPAPGNTNSHGHLRSLRERRRGILNLSTSAREEPPKPLLLKPESSKLHQENSARNLKSLGKCYFKPQIRLKGNAQYKNDTDVQFCIIKKNESERVLK